MKVEDSLFTDTSILYSFTSRLGTIAPILTPNNNSNPKSKHPAAENTHTVFCRSSANSDICGAMEIIIYWPRIKQTFRELDYPELIFVTAALS